MEGLRLCGELIPRGRGGGRFMRPGLLPEVDMSAIVSMSEEVELSMSARKGMVIEIKEMVPCKDCFFFFSSPVKHDIQ